MRWVTYVDGTTERVGVSDGSTVVPTGRDESVVDVLLRSGGDLVAAGAEVLQAGGERRALDAVRLRAPVPRPPSIRDFMSFEQHVKAGLTARGVPMPPHWYVEPVFYFTNPAAVVGPYDDVPMPPGCTHLDFELELGAVIGVECSDVPAEEADSVIAGYTIFNDWSARDLQFREMSIGIGPSKGKDSAITLGPALVTPDELAARSSGKGFDLRLTVSVNGREYGCDSWSNIHWSFGEMIAHASRGTRLMPGDVLGSGTCGSGCLTELRFVGGHDAFPWLRPGDVVSMDVEGIGEIRNTVVPTVDGRAR